MTGLPYSLHAELPGCPAVSAFDRGFQLGDGVFDTLVAFGGTPFAWARHRERLVRAARFIGIDAEAALLDNAMREVCAALGETAILRTTITRGQSARSLWPGKASSPTILIAAQPWSPELLGQPAMLILASTPRNERSPLSRLKTLSYLDNILATREAVNAGADDALILNCRGHVACTSIANVFAVMGDKMLTPPLIDGVLDGIIRGLVLEEAASVGLQAIEQSLTQDDLMASDGVFLTNSVRLVRPVTAIGGTSVAATAFASHLLRRLLHRIETECGEAAKKELSRMG